MTDDPIADFNRWDAEQARWLAKLPACDCCGEPIQQEKAVHYNNKWICEFCEFDIWHEIRDDFLEVVEADE